MKRFRAGPLFNKVLHNFDLTMEGEIGDEQGRLLYLISGHDHTISTFLDTLRLFSKNTRPTFASAVVVELHRRTDALFIEVDTNTCILFEQLQKHNYTNDLNYSLTICITIPALLQERWGQ